MAKHKGTPRARVARPVFDGDSTQDRLLATALKLFAARGIKDVSLRAISAEAGSRNTRACQYHFKNKLGLMSNLLRHIHERIWQPSEKRLQEAISTEATLREILVRGIWPIKMSPYEFDAGAEATILLLYCAYDPDPAIRALGTKCTEPHLTTFFAATRSRLTDLPDHVFNARWAIFLTEALAGQAARIQQFQISNKLSELPSWTEHAEYVSTLLDFAEGGLRAEVSPIDQSLFPVV